MLLSPAASGLKSGCYSLSLTNGPIAYRFYRLLVQSTFMDRTAEHFAFAFFPASRLLWPVLQVCSYSYW